MSSHLTINLKSQIATSNARTHCRGLRRMQLIHQVRRDQLPVMGLGPDVVRLSCRTWNGAETAGLTAAISEQTLTAPASDAVAIRFEGSDACGCRRPPLA